MEGLVDPRIFESRTGLVVGVALLLVVMAAIVVAAVGEALARRRKRAAERAVGEATENERTRRAA